jgi:hypothetical protein
MTASSSTSPTLNRPGFRCHGGNVGCPHRVLGHTSTFECWAPQRLRPATSRAMQAPRIEANASQKSPLAFRDLRPELEAPATEDMLNVGSSEVISLTRAPVCGKPGRELRPSRLDFAGRRRRPTGRFAATKVRAFVSAVERCMTGPESAKRSASAHQMMLGLNDNGLRDGRSACAKCEKQRGDFEGSANPAKVRDRSMSQHD